MLFVKQCRNCHDGKEGEKGEKGEKERKFEEQIKRDRAKDKMKEM